MNEFDRHMGAAGAGETPAGREPNPEQIQRDIELTRERMSENIDQLGEKLSPQNLKRQAKEAITGKAHDTGTRMVDFIRENPLPVVAVGLGAIWLIQQRNRSEISGDRMARFAYTGPERRREGVRGRIADRASHLRETVGGAASGAAERAGELAEDARERVGVLRSRAREQTRRARGGLEHLMEDNPLAVAAGAAVLGLAIGLLVPESEREHRLMGSTRDDLVDRAQTTARRVKDAAVAAGQDVREVVREEVEARTPEIKATIQEAARHVGSEVKGAAERVGEQAKQAAKDRPV